MGVINRGTDINISVPFAFPSISLTAITSTMGQSNARRRSEEYRVAREAFINQVGI